MVQWSKPSAMLALGVPLGGPRPEVNWDTRDAKTSEQMPILLNCSRHLYTKTFAGQAGRLFIN